MRHIPALALVLLLAGCGPALVWDRPATGSADLRADLQDCHGLARQQVMAEGLRYGFPPYGSFWGPGYIDRFGRYRSYPGFAAAGFGGPFGDPFMERDFRENNLQDFCMKARGYRLVPAPPANPEGGAG